MPTEADFVCWVLEERVNEYDQFGSYTRCIFRCKPGIAELTDTMRKLILTKPKDPDFIVELWKGETMRETADGSWWTLKPREFGRIDFSD